MDGFNKAEVGTLQQSATESFLCSCKHKDADMTVMNESVASIQQACKRVRTIIPNKKVISSGKVNFKEKMFTVDEETSVSNLEKKYNELAKKHFNRPHQLISRLRHPGMIRGPKAEIGQDRDNPVSIGMIS